MDLKNYGKRMAEVAVALTAGILALYLELIALIN
jgi:hypothetical protein